MNGIFLHLLLAEIRGRLTGATIDGVEIKDRLVQFILGGRALVVSLYPDCLGMYVSQVVERGFEPLGAMSGLVRSCRINAVVQERFMPVARLDLAKPFPSKETIEAILSFYSEAPNFSVRTSAGQRNLFARFVQKEPKSSILDLGEEELAAADAGFIVQHVEGVDRRMAQELDIGYIRQIRSALQGGVVRPCLISSAPLRIGLAETSGGERYPTFNDLLQAALKRYAEEREKRHGEQDRDARARGIRRQIARLQKKVLDAAEVEAHRAAGELILSNLGQIRRGSECAEVTDPRTNQRVRIALDPSMTPQANAQQYFARYKKAKRGQPKLQERIAGLKKELTALYAEPPAEPGRRTRVARKQPVRQPFHKFTLGSGALVLVGKSARSNDALTFGEARPGDYFFHARGVEGAHAILRSSAPRGQVPPREELVTAAAIAAHFSKARKQRNVPVSYTQRKFLKKDRKGRPGAVILMREEVVFVDPGLPS